MLKDQSQKFNLPHSLGVSESSFKKIYLDLYWQCQFEAFAVSVPTPVPNRYLS